MARIAAFLLLIAAACGGEPSVLTDGDQDIPTEVEQDGKRAEELNDAGDTADSSESDSAGADEDSDSDDRSGPDAQWYDPEAEVACDEENVGDDVGDIHAVYFVDEGELGELCLGEENELVRSLWNDLAALTTPEDRLAIRLYAGFEGNESDDLLAFVTPAFENERGDLSILAVETVSAADDPPEARLTMLHELAHAFTQTPDQLDWQTERADCETFHNESGCAYEASYLNRWVQEFWSAEAVKAAIDARNRDDLGVEVCITEPGFLGDYAATFPDEDFAETFSAYVLGIEADPEVEPRLSWFDDYPEFRSMRERAVASGLTPPPNNFGGCG